MTTRPALEVQQSDLQYSGRLPATSLRLVRSDGDVADRLLSDLAEYGAQVQGLALLPSLQDLAQARLTMFFLGGYGTVQVSPAGADVWLRGPGDAAPNVPAILPQPDLAKILNRVEGVVLASASHDHFATHTFTLQVHAKLLDETPDDLLRSFVGEAPRVFGDTEGAGVRYVFKGSGNRESSWLVAEPSVVIRPGLFVSGSVTYNGESLAASAAADQARNYLRSILESPDCPVRVSDA